VSDQTDNRFYREPEGEPEGEQVTYLPAVREYTSEIVRAPRARAMTDVDSWVEVIQDVVTLSEHVAGTDFVPKNLRGKSAAVAAAILFGRETGMGPMMALQNVHVIEGQPTLRAEHLRAMVLGAGHQIEYVELTGHRCVVKGRRRGEHDWLTIEWSIDMARAAGLTGKQVWKSYPRAMLAARATGELCRLKFPDVTHGIYSSEEIEDMGAPEGATPELESGPSSTGAGQTRKVARKGASKRAAQPAGGAGVDAGDGGSPAPAPPDPAPAAEPDLPAPPEPEEVEVVPEPEPPPPPGDGSFDAVAATGTDEEYQRMVQERNEDVEPADSNEDVRPASGERAATREQVVALNAALTGWGIKDRGAKLYVLTTLVGHQIDSSAELTLSEASAVLDTFKTVQDREQLQAIVDETAKHRGAPAG
jgi:hypothetical protein